MIELARPRTIKIPATKPKAVLALRGNYPQVIGKIAIAGVVVLIVTIAVVFFADILTILFLTHRE